MEKSIGNSLTGTRFSYVPVLQKVGIKQQILVEVTNIKFQQINEPLYGIIRCGLAGLVVNKYDWK
jgi:hypothetical protein